MDVKEEKMLMRKAYFRMIEQGKIEAQENVDAVTKRLANACANAVSTSGCEIRITAESTNRALFYFHAIAKALEVRGLLDSARTRFCQIELNNGSCILIGTD